MPSSHVGDLQMYWERYGSGDPVLFINGTNGDLRGMGPLAQAPLARVFDTLFYDQRGLGQTTIPEGPYSMADYADDAALLVKTMGWDRCHVVGVSFGGMVAQELALRHPHLIDRLVLCCTSSGGAGGSSFDLLSVNDLDCEEKLRITTPIMDRRNDVTTEPWTLAPYFDIIVDMTRKATPQTGDAARGARLQLEARAFHDTWDRLPSMTRPTLVVGGRFDGQAPPENVERLASRLPDAQLAFFEGGHMFLWQDPAAWPAVVEFLQG